MRKGIYSVIPLIPALGILLLLASLSKPTTVFANQAAPTPDRGNCINCHEDLYFLHDTGNWYCLRESPMSCVECHGGNSLATTQEQAHLDRAAHPVINEDISKCQECHPEACAERLVIFDQKAGISPVLVALPYIPRTGAELTSTVAAERGENRNAWLNTREALPILLLAGGAIVVYFIRRKQAAMRR